MTTFDVAMKMIASGKERHEDGRAVQEVLADAILEAPLTTLTTPAGMLSSDDAAGLPSDDMTQTWKAGMPS
jgi:hypothetical protein